MPRHGGHHHGGHHHHHHGHHHHHHGGYYRRRGCYIATAVYGSYDCPQVWTLRRYRDHKLQSSFMGRTIIKVYYFLSPTFVKIGLWFRPLRKFSKKLLDKKVSKLNAKGYLDTPYYDISNDTFIRQDHSIIQSVSENISSEIELNNQNLQILDTLQLSSCKIDKVKSSIINPIVEDIENIIIKKSQTILSQETVEKIENSIQVSEQNSIVTTIQEQDLLQESKQVFICQNVDNFVESIANNNALEILFDETAIDNQFVSTAKIQKTTFKEFPQDNTKIEQYMSYQLLVKEIQSKVVNQINYHNSLFDQSHNPIPTIVQMQKQKRQASSNAEYRLIVQGLSIQK